jgi:UDP-glucose 4-epimerase
MVNINTQRTVLITGCAGLIGNNFARFLLNKNYKVVGIDNLTGGFIDLLPVDENFIFYKLDLDSQTKIREIVEKHKPEVVYHFAAYAAEGLSPFIRYFNYKNNVLASASIINACIQNQTKIVFASSMAVYGTQNPPFTEIMNCLPDDPYGVAKLSIEHDLRCAGNQFNLRYSIIRPHNVIGLFQNIWDKYRNVLGIYVHNAISGKPLMIFGDGEQTRAFSDVKFILEPLEKLILQGDFQTYNIGSDRVVTINELARIVKKVSQEFNFSPKIQYVEKRHEVMHAYSDHNKAKSELNFADDTQVEEVTRQVFEWALEQPKRKILDMKYEIDKDLYTYWR